MSYETRSATVIEPVAVEVRPGGAAADVWLRKNIEMDVSDNGPDAGKSVEFYKADEVHFVEAGTPTVDEVAAAFDELWDAHDDDGLTDAERIDALKQQLADVNAALLELGDMIGGE